MSDIQSLQSDLAYMRGLADDGRQPSRRGGVILAAGGFTYGLASLAAWCLFEGASPMGQSVIWLPWVAATLVFYAILFTQLRAFKQAAAAQPTAPATLSGLAWSAMGGAMGTLILAAAVAHWKTGSSVVWAVVPSVFLALYGAGWTVASVAAGRIWMRRLAWASFAAVAIAFIALTPAVWLAYGAALILLGGVPGVVLARDPRGA